MCESPSESSYRVAFGRADSGSGTLGEGEGGGGANRPSKGKRVVVGKYTRHACTQCKKAKTKCEGGKPICERCRKTGHDCVWTLEDARRPLTRAHEQALKQQNALLRAEVGRLGRELAALRSGSASLSSPGSASGASSSALSPPAPGLGTTEVAGSQRENDTLGSGVSVSPVGDLAPALWRLVPLDVVGDDGGEDVGRIFDDESESTSEEDGANAAGGMESEHDCDVESAYDNSDEDSDNSDVDVNKALVAPTKTLFSEHDDLHLYGLTSVFRLRRRVSKGTLRTRAGHLADNTGSEYDSISSAQDLKANRTRHLLPSLSSHHGTRQDADPLNRADSSHTFSHDAARARPRVKRDRKGKGKPRATAARSISPARAQRHVLLIGDLAEGTWKGCECASDCWSRWLPKGVSLSRREHDVLLDRLFLFFSSWCMRIIPEYFLRDMYTFLHPSSAAAGYSRSTFARDALPKLAHYSPFLHNTLLAVATAFSGDAAVRRPEARARFAEEAKAYIEEECSRPNISTVQALGMLASYYSGQGQQTLGFMYFGMSVRISQALGLFADCMPLLRAGRLRPRQVFDRAWAFHMGCAQDACWSLYVGRECGISLPLPVPPSTHVPHPNQNQNANADSVHCRVEVAELKDGACGTGIAMNDPFCVRAIAAGSTGERLDLMTWRGKGGLGEVEGAGVPQCRTFTIFLWSCQLMKISRRIMDLMSRLASSDGGTEIKLLVTDIDIQLDAWRQDLPAELKLTPSNESSALPNKLMMHAAFWWQLILLHRPFYQRHRAKSVDSNFGVARCNNAAREILTTLRLWRKIYGSVRYAPITLIQTIFASGTIYILQAMKAALGRRPATQAQATALDNVAELVDFLRECAESWECATRIADIFVKLLREQRAAMVDGGPVARRSVKKKRRRMSTVKEGVSDVPAGQTPMAVSVSPLSGQKAEESGSGEASSPVTTTNLSPPFAQHPTHNASLLPFYLHQFNQTHYNTSQMLTSPITAESKHPFLHHHLQPNHTVCHNHAAPVGHVHAGTNSFAYRTGYVSDDSYASDSQCMSADDLLMRDSEGHGNGHGHGHGQSSSGLGLGASGAFDFGFLYNSELSMDAVMPGLGMFDPTGLGGMGLGSAADASTFSAQPPGAVAVAEGGTGGLGLGGVASMFTDMDFTSDGEDRALYDVIAALSNSQHYRF